MWMETAPAAELAQTAFPASPLAHSATGHLQDQPPGSEFVVFTGNRMAFNQVHLAVVTSIGSFYNEGPAPVPEEDSMLVDAAYTAGFFVTFIAVSTGYLLLYVPAGTWGAVKCVFAEEDWNTCWHAYMNRVFHN